MANIFLILLSVLVLAGCAYTANKSIQDITIETPGAYHTKCYAYVDGLKHRFNPPETISIAKSKEDMVIDCMAPGNRRRKIVVEPAQDHKVIGNSLTGILPGLAWDYASNASYAYPDIIRVDFTDALLIPESMPAHNSPDIRRPEDYELEEFRPGTMRLNSDRYAEPAEIKRRIRQTDTQTGTQQDYTPAPNSAPPGKGDLMDISGHLFDDGAAANTQNPAPRNLPSYPGD